MTGRQMPRPTDAELAILNVLWDNGPSTVREVNEVLSNEKRTGYTTTLKLMQIMTDKGLVRRDVSKRTHVYKPATAQAKTQRKIIKNMVDRVFEGSMAKLVLNALSSGDISTEELAEIRRLLDESKERPQ